MEDTYFNRRPHFLSANYKMDGCRAFILVPNIRTGSLFEAGVCSGIITALIYESPSLGACIPAGVTNTQAVRVVVKYIDNRPARLNENFAALALEALRAAWR
jgi:hypothetical protein